MFFQTITFNNEKNTWEDWNLIPIKRIVFNPPEHKYVSIDIPGGDGELDLSDVLTSRPVFRNRVGTLAFRMYDNKVNCTARYSKIMNYLHGMKLTAIVSDDPAYYYEGRFTVSDFSYHAHGNWADISIDYNVAPYKTEITSTGEPWLWDPFNFETGVIRDYSNVTVSEPSSFVILGAKKPTVPTFTVQNIDSENPIKFTYDDGETIYTLNDGESTFPDIVVTEGEHTLNFTEGTGTVAIDFKVSIL